MKKPDFRILAGTAVALAALFAGGCGKSAPATTAGAVSAETDVAGDPLSITPNDSLRNRLRIGEVETAEVSGSIAVPARIEVDERRQVRVGAHLSGRVTSVHVHEGETVEAGQVLADLFSTDLSDHQSRFLKALSQQQLADRAVDRAQQLLKADVIGIAELQRRQAEQAQAAAEVNGVRDQLSVLGMTAEAIHKLETARKVSSVTHVVASAGGTVLERLVTVGQVVQASDTAFVIADLAKVWLVADLPEHSAGTTRAGQAVEAEVPALGARPFRGLLSFVSPMVNPETRTVQVRMDLPNPNGRYKPAMLASMTVWEQSSVQQVVPTTAVVVDEGKEYLFVQTGDSFTLRPVSLGEEFDKVRVLLDGIKPGEKIVLDGAFHMNNQRIRQSVRAD